MSMAYTRDQQLRSLRGPWLTLYQRPLPPVPPVDDVAARDGSFFTGVAVALPISLLLIVALIALVRWVVR